MEIISVKIKWKSKTKTICEDIVSKLIGKLLFGLILGFRYALLPLKKSFLKFLLSSINDPITTSGSSNFPCLALKIFFVYQYNKIFVDIFLRQLTKRKLLKNQKKSNILQSPEQAQFKSSFEFEYAYWNEKKCLSYNSFSKVLKERERIISYKLSLRPSKRNPKSQKKYGQNNHSYLPMPRKCWHE